MMHAPHCFGKTFPLVGKSARSPVLALPAPPATDISEAGFFLPDPFVHTRAHCLQVDTQPMMEEPNIPYPAEEENLDKAFPYPKCAVNDLHL